MITHNISNGSRTWYSTLLEPGKDVIHCTQYLEISGGVERLGWRGRGPGVDRELVEGVEWEEVWIVEGDEEQAHPGFRSEFPDRPR